ncbi:L-dopachrome tautomerase-related protein [Gloeothece verrucosa]|uniref:Major royal jelly protein n=1 Tax=Gloeothece verrucosa (strain PCC 7822) TaxID=497965 RepID=E0ULL4_GLOV7|nr:L-dopachrome tautomerase-related protein [Gloeothece verrucosa]ADN17844.1 major royal jelly protein [Gloeothece verrucosa PCC 7822]
MEPLSTSLEIVAELSQAPGNITLSSDGRIFMSLHQFYNPEFKIAELVDGRLVEFPSGFGSDQINFDNVLGIQCDKNGWVWMLDNGNPNLLNPKLVAWDIVNHELARVFYLPPPITKNNSFVNDLAVDLTHNVIYISDPIQGEEAALIRVDLKTGLATRILQGHQSVIPQNIDLIIDGVPVVNPPDIRPHLGVNGLVLDANNEWLYYCPMHSNTMYRIKSEDLCNQNLSDAQLASKVERYGDRPICDGISIDQNDNLYLGDLAANGVGVIKSDRTYQLFISDERLSWVDSLSFGADGYLYLNCNQLHRSAPLNRGNNTAAPPFYLFRLKPLAPGVVGR